MPVARTCCITLFCLLFALTLPAEAAVVSATWNSATDVPVSASTYTATGNTVNFTLNFAPPTGTNLTVVNNTGLPFINGTFDNLTQGQAVALSYNGVTYNYVAHYYGGTGNDLVLVWANNRAFAWGGNGYGQIGDGTNLPRYIMVPVTATGVLAGKTIVALAQGDSHSLALCSDGSVAAWGNNGDGQLGNNTLVNSNVPVLVNITSGVSALYGKTVVAVGAGLGYSMALCSDGTVATWGYNSYGQLGNNSTIYSTVPVAVNTASGVSALYGKTVVAIEAGYTHGLVLCSDGTMAAWGDNSYGQLGNNSTVSSMVPVRVNVASGISALFGKTVVQLAAGQDNSMALCSDGSVVTWGGNGSGQLGDGSTTQRNVPVAVNTSNGISALYAKSVLSIASGISHSMALCSDGAVATWGWNYCGQLGNNSTTLSTLPVAVNTDGGVSALSGKTVVAIAAFYQSSRALCADGSMASWGYNSYGQLGNNNASNSSVPVLVNSSPLSPGETVVNPASGANTAHSLSLVAEPPTAVTTLAATAVAGSSAVLHGVVSSFNNNVNVTFDYGTTTAYGSSIAATPPAVTGNLPVAASASLTGLLPLTTYHFRVNDGVQLGGDLTFTTPNNDASLVSLTTNADPLSPVFASGTASYTVSVSAANTSIAISPILADTNATVAVNGVGVSSGSVNTVNLVYGSNTIQVMVTAQDGVMQQNYIIGVTRAMPVSIAATYTTGNEVPLTANNCIGRGSRVNFTLNFAPTAGANLMVVNNLGLPFINGMFDNLAQGQTVALGYGGVTYNYVAHYYGGTGNDLVLVWAGTRPVAWGDDSWGQLGNNSKASSSVPVHVVTTGTPLANRTILALSAGFEHSLALCNDGSVVSWGSNGFGEMGISTNGSNVPMAVTTAGTPLAGKLVAAISAGYAHSLALCTDGTVASFGYNYYGELGNNMTSSSSVPVAVTTVGTSLAGKQVVSIGAGSSHSLALCSDGTVSAWGAGDSGQLGNNGIVQSSVPVAVAIIGTPLQSRSVSTIAVGGDHNLALCTDGTLVVWGENIYGQLGNNSTTNSSVPVAVTTTGTALADKTVVAVAAGSAHSLALCSDGTIASWGLGSNGQLGNNSMLNSNVPVAVATAGTALAGKTVIGIAAGYAHSMATCSDGTIVTWGSGGYGQLGNSSKTDSSVPVAVSTSNLAAGERFLLTASGQSANHTMALVPSPVPSAATLAASSVYAASAVLNGTVNANGGSVAVSFDYGQDTNYGTNVAGSPVTVSGSGDTPVSVALAGLTPATTYHFRVNALNSGALPNGGDQTFTTSNPYLSSLTLGAAALSPAFSPTVYSYTASVGSDVSSFTVISTTADSNATVAVNGLSVASGVASMPLSLVYGNNNISIVVTSPDQVSTLAYTVVVTRPVPNPLSASYSSAGDVSLTINGFTATGSSVNFALNYAPVPGTTLMVVNNTGPGFISGTFSNLSNGQVVNLSYNGIYFNFVANYYGGTGNDLVLQWSNNRAFSWGMNSSGQLGDGTVTQRSLPVPVTASGVLAGKTILSLAIGASHCLALCSDSTLAAWGNNASGQIGDGTNNQRNVPVAVYSSPGSSLYGKKVVAIAAGAAHSMALCTDGTVSTWGYDLYGQLGNNMTNSAIGTPVAVSTMITVNGRPASTALNGKKVIAIAAGQDHCLALCSDGTLAAWGNNASGQLGTNSTVSSNIPVAVNRTSGVSALFGKTVTAIAAGGDHSFALCSDGTLVAWGANGNGQLGDTTTTQRNAPVAVSTAAGVSALAGRSVVAISGGGTHSVALCSDGTLAAWGGNASGQLGDTTLIDKYAPVSVSTAAGSSALAGKAVTGITTSASSSFAQCSDGTLAAWGADSSGQLGDNSTTNESAPVAVNSSPLPLGAAFGGVFGGSSASHTLALVAAPPVPVVTTLYATLIAGTSVTLNGTVNASNNSATVTFDYGTTSAYGTTLSASPATVTGGSNTAVSLALTGLATGTTYHFRVNGVNALGTANGSDYTFTTLPSVLQSWRQQYFGTTVNSGTTADAADYDNDGIPNLIEWACNLDPTTRNGLPATVTANGTSFAYTYSRSTAVANAGTSFIVEWSNTLAAGSWSSSGVVQTVLSDDGTTQQVQAVIPITTESAKFVHLSVTAPQ